MGTRKKKAVLFNIMRITLTSILLMNVSIAWGDSYNETELRNDFSTDSWFNSSYNVIRNPGGYYELDNLTLLNGELYFRDILENTSTKAVWYISDITLGNYSIYALFSQDNVTWVRNTTLGDGGNSVYLGDLNYTSLYLRHQFNGNTTSPRFNNCSVIYMQPVIQERSLKAYSLVIPIFILGLLLGVGIKIE